MREALAHLYKNTTIIESDSIKVYTARYIQQIIAPKLTSSYFLADSFFQRAVYEKKHKKLDLPQGKV